MVSLELPYVSKYRVRGKEFSYYRRGDKRIRIRGEFGSPEWRREYEETHAAYERALADPDGITDYPDGTLGYLWRKYQLSPGFKHLKPGTQDYYRRLIQPLVNDYGSAKVAALRRKHIIGWRDEMSDTPRKANGFVAVMRVMLKMAINLEWRDDNPAKAIEPIDYDVESHRRWTEHEIDVMTGPEAGAGALPVLIALYTAQRLGDVLSLKWSEYDGRTLRFKQEKTGAKLVIPAHPILRGVLDMTPRHSAFVCLRLDGKPWNKDHFKHSFADARKALGLPDDMHFHGLRHSAASRLAEAGCTHAEIAAITGHKSLAMVSHYASGAVQERLANSAMSKLPGHLPLIEVHSKKPDSA